MPIVDLPDLQGFSELQGILLGRAMPGYRQVVSVQSGLLGEDEMAWLAEHGVEVRIGTLVPVGKVFVFREETGHE